MRWQHRERGLAPPAAFIPAVADRAIMRPLTLALIEQALSDAARWRADGHHIRVGVNVAAPSLLDADLPDAIAQRLARSPAGPEALKLEVTEETVMADPARALDVLERVRGLGVQVALDDFGTGYSSLARLKRLPSARSGSPRCPSSPNG